VRSNVDPNVDHTAAAGADFTRNRAVRERAGRSRVRMSGSSAAWRTVPGAKAFYLRNSLPDDRPPTRRRSR